MGNKMDGIPRKKNQASIKKNMSKRKPSKNRLVSQSRDGQSLVGRGAINSPDFRTAFITQSIIIIIMIIMIIFYYVRVPPWRWRHRAMGAAPFVDRFQRRKTVT